MKKILLFLTPILILLSACNKKPAFDTNLLIGQWLRSSYDFDEGLETELITIMHFINEKEVSIKTKSYVNGEYRGVIIVEGEYEVSGNDIKYNIPPSQLEISRNEDFYDSSLEHNQAIKELKKILLEDWPWDYDDTVISITEDYLILEGDEGERIGLEKL